MAVKGIQAKADITKKILELFPNSFMNDKEIRIPIMENGEEVQIKVALTAAKVNVEHDAAVVGLSSDVPVKPAVMSLNDGNAKTEPSEDEKARLKELMAQLGL